MAYFPDGNADPKVQAVQAEEILRKLEQLLDTEGWKLVVEYLQGEEAVVMAALANAPHGDVAMRAVGSLLVIKRMQTWPQRTGEAIRQSLKQSP